jgi:ribosomal protein L21
MWDQPLSSTKSGSCTETAGWTAEIVRHGRTRSITVFKKKRRKNYRRTRGHRQGFTSLRITGIATA